MQSRTECLDFLEQIRMAPHIRRHSVMVAEVALLLGGLLNTNGCRLDLGLIQTGALLHDVGKERSLLTGENHAVLGAQMLEGVVDPRAAQIVREHIFLNQALVEAPITESVVVNYSDKRVMHDRVVTLQTRYQDLISRYSKSPSHRDMMLATLQLYLELEKKIFSHLTISPHGAEIMGLKTDIFNEPD